MIRAVLDTNVVVSSFLQPGGIPRQIVQAWKEHRFELCLSELLFDEIAEVLNRPVIRKSTHVTAREIAEFLEQLAEISLFVDEPLDIDAVVAEDPDDDVVLATARAAGADVNVTGDHHLQQLESYRGIPIMSPRKFVQLLEMER